MPKFVLAELKPTHDASLTQNSSLVTSLPTSEILAGIDAYGEIEAASLEPASMEQTNSVSQLSDVKPTDWAFQALQSLVERYGCIAGYPDRTYRGNRALTRYEFAAGLNACMDRVNELLAAVTIDSVKQADLAKLRQLQEEFAAELATLRGRVDALEGKVATLGKQQFSTTTKLTGDLWFNITSAFSSDDVLAERGVAGSPFAPPRRNPITGVPSRVIRRDTNTTMSYYLFLNLNTSFTGKDLLVTQLTAGNGNSPANQLVSSGFFNSWGTPFTDQTGTPTANDLVIRELSYTFPLSKSITLAVGPRLNFYKYYDGNRYTFFARGASSFNSNGSTLSNAVDRGSGVVLTWNLNPQLRFTAGYLGENTEFLNGEIFNTSNKPNNGLFNSTYTIATELAYSPSQNLKLKLHYARTRIKAYNGFIGGAVGEPLPYGYADDGFGGQVKDANSDAFIANVEWNITNKIGVFGRYSWGRVGIDPINPARSGGDIKVQSFQVGLGFPDLGKKGALGVISFVMPHSYLSGRNFLLSGKGDGGNQYDLELSYYYPVNKNIAIVPSFYAIFNPNNFGSNSTVYVGNLRTQFNF
ncbi:MAG: iron uptake porin [Synechococcales bacterium]|nr:iron uptake porin [Synechococcales bacterium]